MFTVALKMQSTNNVIHYVRIHDNHYADMSLIQINIKSSLHFQPLIRLRYKPRVCALFVT